MDRGQVRPPSRTVEVGDDTVYSIRVSRQGDDRRTQFDNVESGTIGELMRETIGTRCIVVLPRKFSISSKFENILWSSSKGCANLILGLRNHTGIYWMGPDGRTEMGTGDVAEGTEVSRV